MPQDPYQPSKPTLDAPRSATLTIGTDSGALPIGEGAAWRVKRLEASAGTLRYIGEAGTVATGYALTETDPDSGWIFTAGKTVTIYADGGNVVYEIARAS